MFKKISAVVILAAASLFVVPLAANAATYVPANQGGSAMVTVTPGAPASIGFTAGAFVADETVTVTVTGTPDATLGVVKASVSKTYAATGTGALKFTVSIPTTATASSVYGITATGLKSGRIGVSTITVAPKDAAAKGLAFTGGTLPVMLIWGGAGILILGIALLVVFSVVRRQRLHA